MKLIDILRLGSLQKDDAKPEQLEFREEPEPWTLAETVVAWFPVVFSLLVLFALMYWSY